MSVRVIFSIVKFGSPAQPRKTVQGGNTFSKKLTTRGPIVTLNDSSIANTNDPAAR